MRKHIENIDAGRTAFSLGLGALMLAGAYLTQQYIADTQTKPIQHQQQAPIDTVYTPPSIPAQACGPDESPFSKKCIENMYEPIVQRPQ